MYASYCSSNRTVNRIVVFSSDTNVIVIACCHCNHLLQNCSEVWIRTSHAKKSQFISIHRIYTREKPTLELVVASVTRLSWCVYFMTQCQVFDINHLLYKLFRSKKLSGEKLPLTHDALILHLSRVAFQVYNWMNTHKALLDLPSPIDNGWMLKDGKLEQHLMSHVPAPRKVAEFVLCRCKKKCKANNCFYRKSNLICTEACFCDNCENWIGNCEGYSDSEND